MKTTNPPRSMSEDKSADLYVLMGFLADWFETLDDGVSIPMAVYDLGQMIPKVNEAMIDYATIRMATGEWEPVPCEHHREATQ